MVVPVFRAGFSRVPHPFATFHPEQAPGFTFDLHVLSAPPAFVLSQDQTLHRDLRSVRRWYDGPLRSESCPTSDHDRRWTAVVFVVTHTSEYTELTGMSQFERHAYWLLAFLFRFQGADFPTVPGASRGAKTSLVKRVGCTS